MPLWLPDGFWPDGHRLASGPLVEVWPAREISTGRRVAVKLWRRPLVGRRQHDLYRREQDAHKLLLGFSGHVVGYIGGSSKDRYPWIATTLHGESLREVLQRQLPLAEAAVLSMDILRGLADVHSTSLLHRDIRPSNVLVRDGRAVLCDLGLAMLAGDTVLDPRAGTPRYRAPELLASAVPSQRTDVYSAALVLRELLGDPAPHPALERVLRQAGSSLPADRPSSAAEFASRFADACAAAGLDLPSARPPEPAPPYVIEPSGRLRERLRLSGLHGVGMALLGYVAIAAVFGTLIIIWLVGAVMYEILTAEYPSPEPFMQFEETPVPQP